MEGLRCFHLLLDMIKQNTPIHSLTHAGPLDVSQNKAVTLFWKVLKRSRCALLKLSTGRLGILIAWDVLGGLRRPPKSMGEREFVLQRPRHRRRRRLAFTAEGHLVYVDKSKWGEKGGKGGLMCYYPSLPPLALMERTTVAAEFSLFLAPKKACIVLISGVPITLVLIYWHIFHWVPGRCKCYDFEQKSMVHGTHGLLSAFNRAIWFNNLINKWSNRRKNKNGIAEVIIYFERI